MIVSYGEIRRKWPLRRDISRETFGSIEIAKRRIACGTTPGIRQPSRGQLVYGARVLIRGEHATVEEEETCRAMRVDRVAKTSAIAREKFFPRHRSNFHPLASNPPITLDYHPFRTEPLPLSTSYHLVRAHATFPSDRASLHRGIRSFYRQVEETRRRRSQRSKATRNQGIERRINNGVR